MKYTRFAFGNTDKKLHSITSFYLISSLDCVPFFLCYYHVIAEVDHDLEMTSSA